ncbi:hypothetical protein ACC691_36490, partial [Rhizobium johnstonii]|uniref:hypothetical protein n=1 Tax=Rhizobium johnstonii TaxID=3019933 RepID=UPI003F9D7C54
FAIVRIGGLVLLVALLLASPAIVVLAAKASRRRSRRRAADATASIAGAWEDYVDTAVDLGLPSPGARTRTEVAREYASPNGHTLALLADAAVFGDVEPASHHSDEFWVMTDAERALLTAEFSRWQRIRGAVSIRSFARFLG